MSTIQPIRTLPTHVLTPLTLAHLPPIPLLLILDRVLSFSFVSVLVIKPCEAAEASKAAKKHCCTFKLFPPTAQLPKDKHRRLVSQ